MDRTRVAAAAAAVAYAVLLAMTKPFTVAADVVTAVGLAAGAAALGVRLASEGRGEGGLEGSPGGTATPWLVLLTVAVGWELYCFFGGPRPAHPTLSTIYDLVARWPAAKAVVVLAWLALGWELVR